MSILIAMGLGILQAVAVMAGMFLFGLLFGTGFIYAARLLNFHTPIEFKFKQSIYLPSGTMIESQQDDDSGPEISGGLRGYYGDK